MPKSPKSTPHAKKRPAPKVVRSPVRAQTQVARADVQVEAVQREEPTHVVAAGEGAPVPDPRAACAGLIAAIDDWLALDGEEGDREPVPVPTSAVELDNAIADSALRFLRATLANPPSAIQIRTHRDLIYRDCAAVLAAHAGLASTGARRDLGSLFVWFMSHRCPGPPQPRSEAPNVLYVPMGWKPAQIYAQFERHPELMPPDIAAIKGKDDLSLRCRRDAARKWIKDVRRGGVRGAQN